MKNEELKVLTFPYPGGRTKTVRVYVPAHEEGEKFPVIYMTDGQNLFEEEVSSFGSWHTREAVEAQRQTSGKAAVIVGIHNDGDPVDRANDLTPREIGEVMLHPDMPEELKKRMRPDGEAFDGFVLNTVMPAVEARFPVKTGRENTAFCGSSSGGVMSLYAALSHPERFGAAGVFSPAMMMYAPQDIARWIQNKHTDNPPFIYLYSGGAGELEQMISMCTQMLGGMLGESFPADRVKTVIKPDQPHNETAWEAEFRTFLHCFLS